jgi:hypothetical protein
MSSQPHRPLRLGTRGGAPGRRLAQALLEEGGGAALLGRSRCSVLIATKNGGN